MHKRELVIGIDTSNYTTSVALMSTDGDLIANLKRPLPVKVGERGLRQSDALFAHTVNLPSIMQEAGDYLDNSKIVAIGVSKTPRNQEGSYMPCFLSGVAAAESMRTATGAPLYYFSHQCGHIMAAVYSCGMPDLLSGDFAAFHISGGTTELVKVTPTDKGFDAFLLGGTADLNAGQVIDRIGVYLGMKFPCGPEMERLAKTNDKKIPRKKISIKDFEINLSGLENMAIQLYKENSDAALTAAFVFDYLGRAISSLIDAYQDKFGKTRFVCAGGVMCNSIIREMLGKKYDVCFAEPSMSADNAVGVAALALRALKSENDHV